MSDLFMDMHQRRLQRRASERLAEADEEEEEDSAEEEWRRRPQHNDAIDGEQTDAFANLLSLKLRKPKHWNWELSTSRSCTNIALPRILLYDHKGVLLCDANSQQEQVFRQPAAPARRSAGSRRPAARRAATSNLAHSIRAALDREFDGLQIGEATPSPEPHRRPSSAVAAFPAREIALSTNDLPDYKFERRSSSLKGVRFKVDAAAGAGEEHAAKRSSTNSTASFQLVDLPTPPSTSTTLTTTPTATTTGSSSSGPREKRRYRRSHSSGRSPANSESILERFSYHRGRFSSPEYAAENDVVHAPRYYLRTSKAGTLVVQAESFSRYRRRRRQKHSSSEHLRNDTSASNASGSLKGRQGQLKVPGDQEELPFGGGSLQNVAERPRRRQQPLRRYRSDGNVLLNDQLSTSEEEEAEAAAARRRRANERSPSVSEGHKRKYTNFRRQNKRELVTIDPENGVLRASFGSPTGR